MENSKSLVREFGKQTFKKTEETAKKLGVSIDDEFMDKSVALNWAMAAIDQEKDGIAVEPIKPYIEIVERMTANERGIAFCCNTCREAFFQLETGDFSVALEIFGLARMTIGYLEKDDIRKMLSKNGQKGGVAKHEPMNRVKARMIEKYLAGNWNSTRQAAKRLEDEAKSVAMKEGARFTTDDIFARLYGWFLDEDKRGRLASKSITSSRQA